TSELSPAKCHPDNHHKVGFHQPSPMIPRASHSTCENSPSARHAVVERDHPELESPPVPILESAATISGPPSPCTKEPEIESPRYFLPIFAYTPKTSHPNESSNVVVSSTSSTASHHPNTKAAAFPISDRPRNARHNRVHLLPGSS